MKMLFALILVILAISCSTPSPEKAPGAPDWTREPTRSSDGTVITYVGVGEDRTPENALFKSEAIALQDLENECSFIPKAAQVQNDHYQQQMGVIYRAFSRVTINITDCDQAKNTPSLDQIRTFANPQLSSTVESYQKSYDAPEAEEIAPIDEKQLAVGIPDASRLYIVRQQVALSQQNLILAKSAPSSLENIAKAKTQINEFEKTHPVSQAFSTGRPNWLNHQASAVRETIQDRAELKQEYNYTPSPLGNSGKKTPAGRGGKGSRRRSQNPQQPSPDASPSPIPTL